MSRHTETNMNLEVIGMRELSVEELGLVSGGDGGAPNPTPPGTSPDPSALNGIINSIAAGGTSVMTSLGATVYVVADAAGSQWCWDYTDSIGGGTEQFCLAPGVSVNGEAP